MKNLENYVVLDNHRKKLNNDKFLVITTCGSWVLLNREQWDIFINQKISQHPDFFKILEKNKIILTKSNSKFILKKYRDHFRLIDSSSQIHTIQNVSDCNYACDICFYPKELDKKNRKMDSETAKAIVDFIFQSKSKYYIINFSGDDPLKNFSVIEFILDYIKKKNKCYKPNENGFWNGNKKISFNLLSNFEHIDDTILDFLIKNKVRIATIFDGPKELHEKVRKFDGAGKYENIVNWINEIRDRKYISSTSAITNITKDSLKHGKEIAEEYLKNSLNRIKLRVLLASENDKFTNNIKYSAEEFFDFWKKFIEHINSLGKTDKILIEENTFDLLKTLKNSDNKTCGDFKQLVYDYKGDIFPCEVATASDIFNLGNVTKTTYSNIFDSKDVLNLILLSSNLFSLNNWHIWNPLISNSPVHTYFQHNNLIPKLSDDFFTKINSMQFDYILKNFKINGK